MQSVKPAHERLASYGTLAPDRMNYHHVADLEGRWTTGTVRGWLRKAGWGVHLGFPGIILDPDGDHVDVHILQSTDLPDHWDRLDAFEGEEYQRVITEAQTDKGMLEVSIYELKRSERS